MKKIWIVRYSVAGFNEKEQFNSKKKAVEYYDKILDMMGYWTDIDIYSININV